MQEVRWEWMFPDHLEAAFAACPLVYFAYGLCEPCGTLILNIGRLPRLSLASASQPIPVASI